VGLDWAVFILYHSLWFSPSSLRCKAAEANWALRAIEFRLAARIENPNTILLLLVRLCRWIVR